MKASQSVQLGAGNTSAGQIHLQPLQSRLWRTCALHCERRRPTVHTCGGVPNNCSMHACVPGRGIDLTTIDFQHCHVAFGAVKSPLEQTCARLGKY